MPNPVYTTTEKLLLAYAIDIFGTSNSQNIEMFLKSHSFSINTTHWQQVYNKLIEDAQNDHYTNIIEYCEDVRYQTLISHYIKKYETRMQIIENKISPAEYLDSIKKVENNMTFLEKQEPMEGEINEYFNVNIKPLLKEYVDPFTASIEPQFKLNPKFEYTNFKSENKVNPHINDVEQQVIVVEDIKSKHNKKYYQRLKEDEKEYDDYLDNLDEYFYNKDDNYLVQNENNIYKVFPVVAKIKNIDERNLLMKNEYNCRGNIKKSSSSMNKIGRISEKKRFSNEKQYKEIEEKVLGKKGIEKNKTNWAKEIKIALEAIIFVLETNCNNSYKDECKEFKNLIDGLKKDVSLPSCIVSILMILQRIIFCADGEVFNEMVEHKRFIISFFDFYRK